MGRVRSLRLSCVTAGLLFFLFYALSCQAAEKNGNSVQDACNGVVRILAIGEDGNGGSGSGFGVGTVGEPTDIYITNWHVVTGEDGEVLPYVYILLSNDAVKSNEYGYFEIDESKMVKCEVLYTTTGYPDIAILKAERQIEGHVALPLMRAQRANRGDAVYTLGFPGSADKANGDSYYYAEVKDVNITTGVLSKFFQVDSAGYTWAIQHDAHINHGNSGGPLVTEDGVVIGINTYGFGDMEMEHSLSIYVDYAMQALDDLGIPYDVYKTSGNNYVPYIILVCVLIAIVVVVVICIAARRKKSKNVWYLQGTAGTFVNKSFPVNGRVGIGRNPTGNALVYPSDSPSISRQHCELFLHEGNVFIRDLGSTYGTYVSGQRIPANQAIPINSNESFYLAEAKESFVVIRK